MIPESVNKLNKNIDHEANDEEEPGTDQEEREDEDKNELYLSENIMFAYAENQVKAHKGVYEFSQYWVEKTSPLGQNIGILIQIQERVI